jgi:hypothetical protein
MASEISGRFSSLELDGSDESDGLNVQEVLEATLEGATPHEESDEVLEEDQAARILETVDVELCESCNVFVVEKD